MAKRKIIKIDSDKCNGCGLCIPNCPEGAIQMIDKKARLISDLFCDGLGACLGHCPQGAITIEEREAVEYDEKKTMENIVKHGENTIKAHLEHLKSHGQDKYYKEALEFLKERGIDVKLGCPGSRSMSFSDDKTDVQVEAGQRQSQLRQWPVQLHLVTPQAAYFQKADVLLSADCVAYTVGDFHKDYLKGKSLAIACPKLDEGKEIYIEKIKSLIDDAKINTLTVMTMEVPCCHGLVVLAQEAAQTAKRKIPIKSMIVSLKGKVLSEEWL